MWLATLAWFLWGHFGFFVPCYAVAPPGPGCFFVANQNLVRLLLLDVHFRSEKPPKIPNLSCPPQWSELQLSALLHSCHGYLLAPLHSASTASTADELQCVRRCSCVSCINLIVRRFRIQIYIIQCLILWKTPATLEPSGHRYLFQLWAPSASIIDHRDGMFLWDDLFLLNRSIASSCVAPRCNYFGWKTSNL